MKFGSPYDMPFDINSDVERAWNSFVELTLKGKTVEAFGAFHAYLGLKEKAFYKSNVKNFSSSQEAGMEM